MLSQWEMYSGRNGCRITFNHEITKLTAEGDVALGPVIYEAKSQRKYLEYLNSHRQRPEFRKDDNFSADGYFLLSVVFLKSVVFSQGKEWRIVKIVQQESFDSIKYSSGSRFLKPYVPIRCEPLPITKIMIGPADDQDRLFRSMEHLTKMTKGYENVTIKRSAIRVSPS